LLIHSSQVLTEEHKLHNTTQTWCTWRNTKCTLGVHKSIKKTL